MGFPFLPDNRKLPVNSPALKGYGPAFAEANTDSDPSTISMQELKDYHARQEAIYRDVQDWGPHTSPQWQARYKAGAIENVMEIVDRETRSPAQQKADSLLGKIVGSILLALGWYPN